MSSEILNKIIETARKYKIRKLYLFGSAAENADFRDIDLACEGFNGWKMFTFAGELENELGMNVDIVTLDLEDEFTGLIKPKLKLIYDEAGTY